MYLLRGVIPNLKTQALIVSDPPPAVSLSNGMSIATKSDLKFPVVTSPSLQTPLVEISVAVASRGGEFVAGVANAIVYVWHPLTQHSPKLKGIRFWRIDHDSPGSTTTSMRPMGLAAPADITCITLRAEEGLAISVDSVVERPEPGTTSSVRSGKGVLTVAL